MEPGEHGESERPDAFGVLLRGGNDADGGDLLAGVQRRIRQGSGGRFFDDGWSTSKQPPVSTYLVTGLGMLALLAASYVVLRPLGGEPVRSAPPHPVTIIAP